MYCDYYKLYNIIIGFIKENRTDLDIDELELKSYPTYKDLEPFQEYKLEDIKDIHSNILVLINKLYLQLNSKVDCVDHYNENHKIGFSISNFLNTLEYENRLLKEQISLYINYVSFFHISEKRQLNRLFMRMQEFYKEIDENININRTFSIADIGEQDRLHRFYIIGEDIEIENILEDFEFTPSVITQTITDPSGSNPTQSVDSAVAVTLPKANNEESVLEKENVAMEMREYTEESQ
jgi:hypothetical protein